MPVRLSPTSSKPYIGRSSEKRSLPFLPRDSSSTKDHFKGSDADIPSATTSENLFAKSKVILGSHNTRVRSNGTLHKGKDILCWKASNKDNLSTLFRPFRDVSHTEVDDSDIPAKKQKLENDKNASFPPYTKEFHVLTEVQRERILKVVEDVVYKLAHDDLFQVNVSQGGSRSSAVCRPNNMGKVFCRKFFLPWVIIKVFELVRAFLFSMTTFTSFF